MFRRTIRIDEKLAEDISKIAADNNMNENYAIEQALKMYRDYMYMSGKASFINENVMAVLEGQVNHLEDRLNHKTNQVLSETAIQLGILNQIIAHSLDVDPVVLPEYRRQAIEFLKTNNRLFRMDEVVE